MSTLKEKANEILSEKSEKIKSGNIRKGVKIFDVTGTLNVNGYPPDWSEIGYQDVPEGLIDAFNYAKTIQENWDSSITSMIDTFRANKKLVFLPMIDTSNVTNMSGAFQNCTSLISVPLLDTSNVTNITNMFSNCSALKYIPKFNTSKVSTIDSAFTACSELKEIDLDFTYAFSTSNFAMSVFNGCASLESIKFGDIDNINRSTDLLKFTGMFSSCSKLDDDTLNRILKLLPKLKPVNPGTLSAFGVSQANATRCESLSNYQAFINAGWSTGY